MSLQFVDDETFENKDYSNTRIHLTDFEACHFINCNFSRSDLSSINFSECTFNGCDFSSATVTNTGFKSAQFERCKMIGVRFDLLNPFLLEMEFSQCNLDYAVFQKLKLVATSFDKSSLNQADFTSCDLKKSSFVDADLLNATFHQSNLAQADFRKALRFNIDPETNNLAGAKFTSDSLGGLLTKYNIKIE